MLVGIKILLAHGATAVAFRAHYLHCDIIIIIITMYIYHVLIKALSAQVIHINQNMMFYAHVEHSPNKTIYIKYYMEKRTCTHAYTHRDCSRNRVLKLVGMKILWEEEGFQFGFKRWKDWAGSKVLWEWIPNVGSKAREGAKGTSLAIVLLDFLDMGVTRRAQCTRQSVDM